MISKLSNVNFKIKSQCKVQSMHVMVSRGGSGGVRGFEGGGVRACSGRGSST